MATTNVFLDSIERKFIKKQFKFYSPKKTYKLTNSFYKLIDVIENTCTTEFKNELDQIACFVGIILDPNAN